MNSTRQGLDEAPMVPSCSIFVSSRTTCSFPGNQLLPIAQREASSRAKTKRASLLVLSLDRQSVADEIATRLENIPRNLVEFVCDVGVQAKIHRIEGAQNIGLQLVGRRIERLEVQPVDTVMPNDEVAFA